MAISGKLKKQLQDALLESFQAKELEQLVSFDLDIRLGNIAGGADHSQVVFNLIDWAERKGRLGQLVAAARASNPHNAKLRAAADALYAAGLELADSAAIDEDPALAAAGEGYRRLHQTLRNCGLAVSADQIAQLCSSTHLAPWGDNLVARWEETQQPGARITAAISYLSDRTHPVSGENGLVLLLRVLSEQHPDRSCTTKLRKLEREFETRLADAPPWWRLDQLFRYSGRGVNEKVTRREKRNYLYVSAVTVLASLVAGGLLMALDRSPDLKRILGLSDTAMPTVLGLCIGSFCLALTGFPLLGLIVIKWFDKQIVYSFARNLSLLGLVYLGCAAISLLRMLLPSWAILILLVALAVSTIWWIIFKSMLGYYLRKRAYGDMVLEGFLALLCFALLGYPVERLVLEPLFG